MGNVAPHSVQFVGSNMKKVQVFFREVLAELHKVTWPKRDELVGSAIVVVIFVICFSIILGGMDLAFSELMSKILRQSGF